MIMMNDNNIDDDILLWEKLWGCDVCVGGGRVMMVKECGRNSKARENQTAMMMMNDNNIDEHEMMIIPMVRMCVW